MSIPAQTLKLCAVSVVGCLVLLAIHGVPVPAGLATAEAPVACGVDQLGESAEIRWITPADARQLVGDDGVAFVDCRALDAFEQGHVSGSLHLPLDTDPTAEPFIDSLRGATTVITYCNAACERSAEMASRFSAAGLPDVRVLEGGMPAWLRRGFPAESGACYHCDSHN